MVTVFLKVETDIITRIAASPIGRTVLMYVKTFKTEIVFVGIKYDNVFNITLTNVFQY